jgi:peptidoglycan/LPS O-acetylase OafA/YrhL
MAVLLVIASHLPGELPIPSTGYFAPFVKVASDFGWTGVDLFFVISGFLIGGLIFKEWQQRSTFDIRQFLIRRAFRIWPAYFSYIAIMTVLCIFDGTLGTPRQALTLLFPNFLHLQSYVLTPLPHTWSLAVEEHFYLALPLILLLLANRPQQRLRAFKIIILISVSVILLLFGVHYSLPFLSLEMLPDYMQACLRPYLQFGFLLLIILELSSLLAAFALPARFCTSDGNNLPALPLAIAGVLILCLAFRVCNHWLTSPLGIGWSFNFFASHLRMDSLFFGVLLGYWYHFRGEGVRRIASYRVSLCLVGTLLVSCPIYIFFSILGFNLTSFFLVSTVGFNLLYVGYGCVLLVVIHTALGDGWLGKFLASFPARAVAFVGYYSYSIYLWHFTFFRIRIDHWLYDRLSAGLSTEPRWLAATVISVAGAILVGVLMAKVIEQPFLRLRDKMFPARAKPLASYDEALAISPGDTDMLNNGRFALLVPKRLESIASRRLLAAS